MHNKKTFINTAPFSVPVALKMFTGSTEFDLKFTGNPILVSRRASRGCASFTRKAEELPYHLELLGEQQRLRSSLLQWNIFNQLYSEDHSTDLLRYWQKCGGYEEASLLYADSLSLLKKRKEPCSIFAINKPRLLTSYCKQDSKLNRCV